ncbi:MAG: type II toxin-antitoxin system VapC family toxin [Acidobacteriota bacterium]|nr:type II toxin-antitoxin system VapC family toxin [Acidobacteriota bacterium]
MWIQSGGEGELSPAVIAEIEQAAEGGALLVSAMSVWELSMLAAKNRVILRTPLLEWVRDALKTPGLSLVPLSPEIAVESTQLPGQFHGDPADRIIVASARYMGATLLTRDRGILSYSKQLHVRAIAA